VQLEAIERSLLLMLTNLFKLTDDEDLVCEFGLYLLIPLLYLPQMQFLQNNLTIEWFI